MNTITSAPLRTLVAGDVDPFERILTLIQQKYRHRNPIRAVWTAFDTASGQ